MNDLRDIIKFYKDCYQFDLKGIRIRNFLSNQFEKRLIPQVNDFFIENYGRISVDQKWGEDVEQLLYLDAKEKALFAGSYFIKGTQNLLGKIKDATIPLYIHELNLIREKNEYFLSINDTYLNPDFIEKCTAKDKNLEINADDLGNGLPKNPIGFSNLIIIEEFLKTHFSNWDLIDLKNYHLPEFNFKKYQKDLTKAKAEELKIYSGLMIGVFKKTKGSIGVLDELKQLAESKLHSKLTDYFFGINSLKLSKVRERNIHVPTTLSETQKTAIFKAEVNPISLIIGPPGTGKSFTIAALAVDAIYNKRSVLIVTRNPEASRVISNYVENSFSLKNILIKADTKRYKRSLIARLNKFTKKSNRDKNLINYSNKIVQLNTKIGSISKKIDEIEENEIKWGKFYNENHSSFFSHFQDKWIKYRKRNLKPIWELVEELDEHIKNKIECIRWNVMQTIDLNLKVLLNKNLKNFTKLKRALREKNLSLKNEKLSSMNFKLIIKALPLWTTTIKDISEIFPLEKELFDLVIIDEASQCEISSIIPILHRAKNLVVVGDPQQLRHITFLSDEKQNSLKELYQIDQEIPDYRRDSVIDWINSLLTNEDQVSILDEHFRSKSDIIRFSNNRFYSNELKIIRSTPIADKIGSLEEIQTNGERDNKGINRIEANSVIKYFKDILTTFNKVSPSDSPTVGIISPFTTQVNFLKKTFSKEFGLEDIKKHKLLIGTPFHFQGDERDIILISFALDNNFHSGTINYLNKEDVFNVLITRARDKQIIFTSVDKKLLPSNSLLKNYLEKINELPINETGYDFKDHFFDEVSDFLIEQGCENIHKSLTVSGVLIDMVAIKNGRFYCIDLIGYPGSYEAQSSLESIKMMNRMRTPIFFLPYSSWYLDHEKSTSSLTRFINQSN